jgi:hypothetical protein
MERDRRGVRNPGIRGWTERGQESQLGDRLMSVRQPDMALQAGASFQQRDRRGQFVHSANRPKTHGFTRIQPREESGNNHVDNDDDVICIGEQAGATPTSHSVSSDKGRTGKVAEQANSRKLNEETSRNGSEMRKKPENQQKDVVITPATKEMEVPSNTALIAPPMKQNTLNEKKQESKNVQSLTEDNSDNKNGWSSLDEHKQLAVSELETKEMGKDVSIVDSNKRQTKDLEDKDTIRTPTTQADDKNTDTNTPVEQSSGQSSSLIQIEKESESGEVVAMEETKTATVSDDDDEHEDFEELILKKELIQQELQKINEKEAQEKIKRSPQKLSREHHQQSKNMLKKNKRAKQRARARSMRRANPRQQAMFQGVAGEKFVRERLESDIAAFMERGVLPGKGIPTPDKKKDENEKDIENESSGGEDEEERLRQQLLKSIDRKGSLAESLQMAPREDSRLVEAKVKSKESRSVGLSVAMATPSVKQAGVRLMPKPGVTSVLSRVSNIVAKSKSKQETKKQDTPKASFVIEVNANDSDSDIDVQEVEHLQAKQQAKHLTFSGFTLEEKIKQLRKSSEQSSTEMLAKTATVKEPITPDSISHLPKEKLEEYRRLRIEIVNRERKRKQPQPNNSLSKRPKSQQSQALPTKPKPVGKSAVFRAGSQSKGLSASAKKQVNNQIIQVNGEMHVAAVCTRLAAETTVLTGKVDKLKLFHKQLMDGYTEVKHSCETVRKLQSPVKRLGKHNQQKMLERSEKSVQSALAMMELLSELVSSREMVQTKDKMDNDSVEDGGKTSGLKLEALWQLKVSFLSERYIPSIQLFNVLRDASLQYNC